MSTLYPVMSRPSPKEDIENNGTEVDWHPSPAIACAFLITVHSLSGVVNNILGDNCTSLDTRGNAHGSGVSSSLHQAVTWYLSCPFYNYTLHLTGVYIFPNEGNLEESFDTLTAHSNHPSHEPHIYAGDFNAYTSEEMENHITPLDSHTFFRRTGDTNPAHSPASPLTTATAPAADYRGCLLLHMLNSIEIIITNGHFPVLCPNHRPYTFPENQTLILFSTTIL